MRHRGAFPDAAGSARDEGAALMGAMGWIGVTILTIVFTPFVALLVGIWIRDRGRGGRGQGSAR